MASVLGTIMSGRIGAADRDHLRVGDLQIAGELPSQRQELAASVCGSSWPR
jgi:hypothetical protein